MIWKDRRNDPSLSPFTEKNSFAVVTSVRNHNRVIIIRQVVRVWMDTEQLVLT